MRWPFARRRREAELDEELRGHIELAVRERVERGEDPADARAAALREFGNYDLVRAVTRDTWRWSWLDDCLQDFARGARALIKRPGLTGLAVLTLGLGIGANTAVFGIVNAMLLRPLSATDPDRLVRVEAVSADGRIDANTSFPNFLDLAKADSVFGAVLASNVRAISMRRDETAERRIAEIVTGNYFSMLGVEAALGRALMVDDDQPGAPRVTVLSHHLWRLGFAADPHVLGETVQLNGDAYTIVGVAPRAFASASFPGAAVDFWVPLQKAWRWIGPDPLTNRDAPGLRVTGRLTDGIGLTGAQAATDAIAARLDAAYPETNRGETFRLRPARVLDGRARSAVTGVLSIFMGFVGLVLVAACANFVNVLLAREVTRRREAAVRMALGAGAARLVRQHIAESGGLAILLGGAGLLFSAWMTTALARFDPLSASLPIRLDLTPDARVFLFVGVISLAAAVVVGIVPALQSARGDLVAVLRAESVTVTGGRGSSRLSGGLVIAQVAISSVLLIGAGLMLRGVETLRSMDVGFSPRGTIAMDVDATGAALTQEAVASFFQALGHRVAELPGVESVGFTSRLPLSRGEVLAGIHIEGHEPPAGESSIKVSFNRVSPRYFETLRVPIVSGRDFDERDDASHPDVLVVDETMARRFWPGSDPLGELVRLADEAENRELAGRHMASDTLRVIGVARNVQHRSIGGTPQAHMYVPFAQRHDSLRPARTLVVRTAGGSAALAHSIERAVEALNREVLVFPPRTLEEQAALSLAPLRLAAAFSGILGSLALLLATTGLYGVVAFWVAQRAREIAVRIAVGASGHDIRRLVLRRGLALVGAGLALGVGLAAGLGQWLQSALPGVSARDPFSYVAAVALLSIVAVLACAWPARRASSVDPIGLLRIE